MEIVVIQDTIIEQKSKILCKRCHRELKNIDAQKLGYGKTCYAKATKKPLNCLFEVLDETNR